jgi:hypothetical protein
MDFGASMIKVAMEQLARGWMETIVQMAEGSDGGPNLALFTYVGLSLPLGL